MVNSNSYLIDCEVECLWFCFMGGGCVRYQLQLDQLVGLYIWSSQFLLVCFFACFLKQATNFTDYQAVTDSDGGLSSDLVAYIIGSYPPHCVFRDSCPQSLLLLCFCVTAYRRRQTHKLGNESKNSSDSKCLA